MSVYKRDDVLPEWEPIPWDAEGPQVDEQEKGFHQRALKPLIWTKVDWNDFPEEGIFGRDRDWFVSHDIAYATTFDDEDLILIENTYFGFPIRQNGVWHRAQQAAQRHNGNGGGTFPLCRPLG